MGLTIDQVKLCQPYILEGSKGKKPKFIVLFNRNKDPLCLQYNPTLNSILVNRWKKSGISQTREIYNLKEYKDSRHVIKVLFKAQRFVVEER